MKKLFFFMAICLYALAAKTQNVGIGTSNPLNKLHVAGGLRLDTLTGVNGSGIVTHNANGVIYGLKFSGNINEVLRGDGSFGSPSGTPGGTNYWSANGTNIYNNNTGNVGVGTTAPQSRFHANGTSWFTGDNTPLPAAAGKGIAIGQSGENGYLFSFDYSTFTPKNLLLQSPGGNVGIGTSNPLVKLTVQSPAFGIEHTNGTVRLGTFLSATGGWLGTISNHPLYFYTNNSRQQMTLNQSGFLGVGTTNPLVKLHVNGTGFVESSVQSTNERAILSLNSTIGGQNRVWTLENGVFGNAGQFAIYDRTAGQARLSIRPAGPIDMQGSTTQNLGGYGLPKAMLYIKSTGFNSAQIVRCYNGVNGAATSGCGFSVSYTTSNKTFAINMGFSIDDRFIVITPVDVGGGENNIKRQFYVGNNTGGNLIYIHAEHIVDDGSTFILTDPIEMMVIVY